MRIVYRVPPPCQCEEKLTAFAAEHDDSWGVGTVAECDCGQGYILAEVKRNRYWVSLTSAELAEYAAKAGWTT